MLSRIYDAVFYRTLCNTGIFRARGIFRTLSNVYDGKFYSQPCVTSAYLEPRHIQNTAKHLSRSISFKNLVQHQHIQKPTMFKTLVYSEIKAYSETYHISKMERLIKNPVYLQQIQRPYIFKTSAYSELVFVSYSLMYQLFFRTTKVLLYPLIKI